MKITITILILFLFVSATVGQINYGYYDSDKVFDTLPEYSQFKDSINIHRNQIKDTIRNMFIEYNMPPMFDTTKASALIMKSYHEEMADLHRRIICYDSLAETRLDIEENNRKLKLNNILIKYINEFSQKNNVLILGNKQAMPSCKECLDYTNDLIKFIINK
jgi:Skp family chaperone for outer membrane proteins